MDAMTIIYIVVALILGTTISYFLLKKNIQTMVVSEDSAKQEELIQKYEQQLQENTKKGNELKEKYERLLAEANDKVTKLDEQLNEAVNGNLDEVVKKRLGTAPCSEAESRRAKETVSFCTLSTVQLV